MSGATEEVDKSLTSSLKAAASPVIEATIGGLSEVSKLLISLFAQVEESIEGKEKAVALGLILLGSQLYYYYKFSYWSRRNVKTPRPLPFVGNTLSYLLHTYHDLSREWSRKYGKVYGYYQGARPFLVVADAKVLKQISIKDFDKFTNRHFIDLPSEFNKASLLMREDDEWRSFRSILSPTFSSSKMKIMYRMMDKSVEKLIKHFEEEISRRGERKEFDIRESGGQISLGTVIASLFGVELSFGDANNTKTVQYFSRKSLEAFTASKFDVTVELLIPHSILKLLNWPNLREKRNIGLQFYMQQARSIIRHRLKSGERHNDYLQILLEARGEELELAEVDAIKDEHHALDGALDRKAAESKLKLSEADIVCQTTIFLLVGTETTAGLIANTLYLLAFHQEAQQRLYQELASIRKIDEDGKVKFDYEDIGMHQYLDCVISESLRIMPPALYLDRKAGADYFLEDYQTTIEKGTPIILDFYGIMNDPEYWPEPQRFDPDRFSPENKGNIVPGSYCPFGVGPRHCIGYRFALTEGKLAIAKLVSQFEFHVAPDAKYPPEPRKPLFIGNEFKSLRVLVERRK